jgi:extracellular factor (EF) 3-hydroxypalmitic acid methyl ester biosynthesis protein
MEFLQEWNLMLRDDDRMLFLAPELGHQRVTSDATGVNVFLEIRKPVDQDTLPW